MPYIKTTVSKKITDAQRDILKSKLGNAIALIPGKTEAWLMLAFEDNVPMYFKGDNSSDYAYVEVSLFGSTSDSAYDRMTACVSEIISETLGIDGSNVYIKYEEAEHWGWNGTNF